MDHNNIDNSWSVIFSYFTTNNMTILVQSNSPPIGGYLMHLALWTLGLETSF